MTEETCGNCRFWRHLDTREGQVPDGTCRKRAPTGADFPMVAEDDWCGEWEGKAEKALGCPHYWGDPGRTCLFDDGHDGEHQWALGESDMETWRDKKS